MKVIKHGNTVKELTCPECGCIFTVAGTDVCCKPAPLMWVPFFACPECGHECGREDQNDESQG